MSAQHAAITTATASRGFVRPLLWLLFVISATGNVITSVAHLVMVSIAFGAAALATCIALGVHHYRGRQSL